MEILVTQLNTLLDDDMENIFCAMKEVAIPVNQTEGIDLNKKEWFLDNLEFLKNMGPGLLGNMYIAKLNITGMQSVIFIAKVISFKEINRVNGYKFI
jgi:hypothetical protein